MDALLVIDVDTACWREDIRHYDAERQRVGSAIKSVIDYERTYGGLIVFVIFGNLFSSTRGRQQTQIHSQDLRVDTEKQQCIGCDPKFVRIEPFLRHRHGDLFEPVFIKYVPDAFSNRELDVFLRQNGVTEIKLVGCNTFDCIFYTVVGGLMRGFDVTLLEEGTYPAFRNIAEQDYWKKSIESYCQTAGDPLTVSIRKMLI